MATQPEEWRMRLLSSAECGTHWKLGDFAMVDEGYMGEEPAKCFHPWKKGRPQLVIDDVTQDEPNTGPEPWWDGTVDNLAFVTPLKEGAVLHFETFVHVGVLQDEERCFHLLFGYPETLEALGCRNITNLRKLLFSLGGTK